MKRFLKCLWRIMYGPCVECGHKIGTKGYCSTCEQFNLDSRSW
jgi:hypothetical protein